MFRRHKKFSFSAVEVKEILISVVVLSIVFSYPEFLFNPIFIGISFLAIGVAFIGHELMHKFVAQHYGYWSEYRLWRQGLLLALFFAILSGGRFIFAAPGAVMFSSRSPFGGYNKSEVGKIGIAGVVFNILLLYLMVALFFFIPNPLVLFVGIVNAWLALFNLLPIKPLDGSKVMAWNWRAWLLTISIAVIGFLFVLLS